MSPLEMQEKLVTPRIAAKMLESRFPGNRPISQHRVADYARMMADGEWDLTGDTIKFSREGELVDGQHRLSAVVQANTPVRMVVVRGVQSAAFGSIDVGRRRTAAQFLQGYKNAALVAAAVSGAFFCLPGVSQDTRVQVPRFQSVKDVLEAKPWIGALVSDIKCASGRISALSDKAVMVAAIMLTDKGYDRAGEFFCLVARGANLSLGSPEFILHRALISPRRRPGGGYVCIERYNLCVRHFLRWDSAQDKLHLEEL